MEKNAIILAAGKSKNFAPFTYEKPKGLFKIKNEVLIERQIEQLLEANVKEIILVVGHMKEKYFYLQEKYNVKLLSNNKFDKIGNLCSLYEAKEYLGNTFVCAVDNYFVENPFIDNNEDNLSYRACTYQSGGFKDFGIEYNDENVITDVHVGGKDMNIMTGHAYFNDKFSKKIKELMEEEILDFRVDNLYWEEFYLKHIKKLNLKAKLYESNSIVEFDDIEDLCKFDIEFFNNLDSQIIKNIVNTIKCEPNEVEDIKVINAGLTNISFSFCVGNIYYVYRHPGSTSGNLINRETEIVAQNLAKEVGVDKSLIHIDDDGWKLSYLITDLVKFDIQDTDEILTRSISYIKRIHNSKYSDNVKVFDNVKEGLKLIDIASLTKGNLSLEFKDLIDKVKKLYELSENDTYTKSVKKVLCHNDTYTPNYLLDKNDELYLIDWEYAGVNYPINDIACIICRGYYNQEEVDRMLRIFYERELTKDERRHAITYITLCGFYWFSWGLYKGSVGDDDSFFFLPAYTTLVKYIDVALDCYK